MDPKSTHWPTNAIGKPIQIMAITSYLMLLSLGHEIQIDIHEQ